MADAAMGHGNDARAWRGSKHGHHADVWKHPNFRKLAPISFFYYGGLPACLPAFSCLL